MGVPTDKGDFLRPILDTAANLHTTLNQPMVSKRVSQPTRQDMVTHKLPAMGKESAMGKEPHTGKRQGISLRHLADSMVALPRIGNHQELTKPIHRNKDLQRDIRLLTPTVATPTGLRR
jgi:hypothetical protein